MLSNPINWATSNRWTETTAEFKTEKIILLHKCYKETEFLESK